MSYCLNSTELESILLSRLKGNTIEDVNLISLLDSANQWQDKLLCMTFSLARTLEKHRSSTLLSKTMISELFAMPEKMFLDIQECDESFVDYMLQHEHSGKIDLEISLLTIARKLSEHVYGKETLRN